MRLKICASRAIRAGFTLTELLVVLAVLVILMGLISPTLNAIRGQARNVQCVSNLRVIGAALLVYAQDHSGKFPQHSGTDSIYPQIFEWGFWRPFRKCTTFYDDYLPNPRSTYTCPVGLANQQKDPIFMATYASFPALPPGKTYLTINYSYFGGVQIEDGRTNTRCGPRRLAECSAQSTLIADLMTFTNNTYAGEAAYTRQKSYAWNHNPGANGGVSEAKLAATAGGNLCRADGAVVWVSGIDNLQKYRKAMNGATARSQVATQAGDP